jgi:hypothetical protein
MPSRREEPELVRVVAAGPALGGEEPDGVLDKPAHSHG